MRSADNRSHLSFVHVSPSGLTGNLNGEGEAHLEVSEKFQVRLGKVPSAFTTCSDTSFEREKFWFIKTKVVLFL